MTARVYVRDSGCVVLPPRAASRRLSAMRVIFAGDSVAWQQAHSWWWLAENSPGGPHSPGGRPAVAAWDGGGAAAPTVDKVPLQCVHRFDERLDADFADLLRPERVAERGHGVLVLNSGLWYNLRAWAWADPQHQPAPGAIPRHLVAEWPRRAAELRRHTCGSAACAARTAASAQLDERDYACDLCRLAAWVGGRRGRLPAHVVWLDSLPQHFGPAASFLPGTYLA
eukprot:gene19254-41446_t